MASYPAAWLALREPADHAARNRDVLAAVAAALGGRRSLSIVDLACGTGSTIRGCALTLPARQQQWTLVDHDPLLLTAARERLVEWADAATMVGESVTLERSGTTMTVNFRLADLKSGIDALVEGSVDLVTASALFDLVSRSWIAELVLALKTLTLPLYAAITYDGQEQWLPPHPDDDAVHRAFLAHQQQVKAFGPAVGPDAGRCLADTLSQAGYVVTAGASPWRLGTADADLVTEVAKGVAGAAAETGQVARDTAENWVRFRGDSAHGADASTVIGHVDLCAFPGDRV